VNVAAELVEAKVVAEDVFQEPAMDSVEDPKVRTAGPVELRLLSKTDVEPVSVRAPDQMMLEAKVVLIPGFTSRLNSVCVTSMEPPETLTTMVEAPVANAPADVLND